MHRHRRQRAQQSVPKRWLGLAAAVVGVLGFALSACGGSEPSGGGTSAGGGASPAPVASVATAAESPRTPPEKGGTLRVGFALLATLEQNAASPDGVAQYALDPQASYAADEWEILRCCLLRTLLSYSGRPTSEGGAELRPDLAAGPPLVSADGLTWTFRLKPGLHYAPPYEEAEIVAGDVIRAVERIFRPIYPGAAEALGQKTIGVYSFYYAPLIVGAEEFAAGTASSISGLEAPDDHTLVVHLTQPAGDLGHRFSLPATAPIPPGATDGHDSGYGPFLVASGPYMLESYVPGRGLALVRNPSWDPASDDLRAAYPDRIELSSATDANSAYASIGRSFDLVLDAEPPADLVARYRTDPELRSRLVVVPQETAWYAAMNLAQPPFDDVHVRRAVNLVVDKARILEQFGPLGARPATHLAPDSLEGNLLLDYDPYSTPGGRGDLAAARAEMAQSRYDTDADGRCDLPLCAGIRAVALDIPFLNFLAPNVANLIAQDLREIGLQLDVERVPADKGYRDLDAQKRRYGIVLDTGWAKDFPNGSGWFSPVLTSDVPSENVSLVGVAADQLATWGYPVTTVPSVHEAVDECIRQVGGIQTECWAALDQRVMEQVVPWVPYAWPNETRIVSERVVSTSIDQFTNRLSLDRVALRSGSR